LLLAMAHNNLAVMEIPSYKLPLKATLNHYSYTFGSPGTFTERAREANYFTGLIREDIKRQNI